MQGDSYTLREVAELLGVSKRTLQRRISEGAFPGRFLAPGRHGLETRIPGEDVQRALDDLRRGAVREASLTEIRLPTVTPFREIEESRRPAPSPTALTHRDLETLRDAVLAIVREDRENLIAALRDALEGRDRELNAVRGQLTAIHGGVERIRQRLEEWTEEERRRAPPGPEPDGAALLREIDEIAALLGQLDH